MGKLFYIDDMLELFDDVQRSKIFVDQKTMADAVPKFPIEEINGKYKSLRNDSNFNLKQFVLEHFCLVKEVNLDKSDVNLSISDHIENLWDKLYRNAKDDAGTLIELPKSYLVPGGRFVEFFYWDSYYIMLGLQNSGRVDMMKNILDNCSYLIKNFGLIPNANRTYFLSRSQPPYFSLMVELYAETIEDPTIYQVYEEALESEYNFWMSGIERLNKGESFKRVVKLDDGTILNRHYDNQNEPRPESYLIDLEIAKSSENCEIYRNIRSACESGWDFSSRWFRDYENQSTIRTTEICCVDLNCLLWHLEKTLSYIATLNNDISKSNDYNLKSLLRAEAIQKYFWNEKDGLYKDFDFLSGKQTDSEHAGTLFPLFFHLASNDIAAKVFFNIKSKFLFSGGVVITTKETGEQWDYPNAWAPYQWIAYKAAQEYNEKEISKAIINNWCSNVERVYQNTGKLMEKYNAVDINIAAGGGEYPNQDGFGWTNAVYIKLKSML